MFKGLITAGTYASGNIPISLYKNTDGNFSLNNNAVSIKRDGIVNIKANVIITATSAGSITVQLYGNGSPISGATATEKFAENGIDTLVINDVVVVANQSDSGYATLSLQLSAGCTIVGGDIICEFAG